METSLLVIFTFLFFHIFGTSSNTSTMTSSNVTCMKRERQSLLAFKQNLTDRYNLLSTWSGVECCKWHGVRCDNRNDHVVKLDLRSLVSLETIRYDHNKWLEGELSPSLQNLKHLRYLDLSMNGFSGNIPEFLFLGSFVNLEYLNLSVSGLRGEVPHHLGNLSRLQYLDLRNIFVTNFPDRDTLIRFGPRVDALEWVSSLSSLMYLDLSGIRIGEHIEWSHSFNMPPSLLILNLVGCDVSIPSIKFVNFTSLNSLDLSSNGINSTIPVWLSNLTGLMHLNLDFNEFQIFLAY